MPRKIGIYAGAFNPIHDGHLAVAVDARDKLGLDEVDIMVEGTPWSNKRPIALHHRHAMVDLAIAGESKIFQLDTIPERFTIEHTLPLIESEFPEDELYFIFGADVFMKMNELQWPGLDKMKNHYFVIFERKGITEKELSRHAIELGVMFAILPTAHPHISSTDVRLYPHDRELLIPARVASYITAHHLYDEQN